jgi:hypothetical protein
MPSPFPGMDPYLEHPAHWPDFHARFINYFCEALVAVLPENYTARIGERVYLMEAPPETRRLIGPDVALERQPGRSSPAVPTNGAVATLEPVTVPLIIPAEARETYIEILHRPDRTLIAVLELLLPANKEEPGRSDYLSKRNAVLRQKVHLVELDLLLGGQRLPMRSRLPPGDYYAFVARAERRPDCDVYAWTLPQRLPTLPVPLRSPDADVLVDLQSIFALVYERGVYGRDVDYGLPPPVAVPDAVLTWIAGRLKSRPP